MRDAILPAYEEDEDEVPVKKTKMDEALRKKNEDLERKLAAIQKHKTPPPVKSEPRGASMIKSALGLTEKKIPIEDKDGHVIESRTPPKTVNFGAWEFPSFKLLNEIVHKNSVSADEIEEKSLLIQKTLLQFGIDVDMEGESV